LPAEPAIKPGFLVEAATHKVGSKLDATTSFADHFIPVVQILLFNCIFELIDLKRINTAFAWS
jgi:hypothetical protein